MKRWRLVSGFWLKGERKREKMLGSTFMLKLEKKEREKEERERNKTNCFGRGLSEPCQSLYL